MATNFYCGWIPDQINLLCPKFIVPVSKSFLPFVCSRKYPYPSHGRFFSLNPPPPLEIPYFPPSPLEYPLTLLRVGIDIFWNCTFYLAIKLTFWAIFRLAASLGILSRRHQMKLEILVGEY